MKKKLQSGAPVLGTWCEVPSPYLSHVLAGTGLDFFIIDMEHSVMDFKVAQEMVFAAKARNCSVLVRVPYLNESDLLRALDTGAEGIIVSQIDSTTQAESVARMCQYAPQGTKGLNPYVTSSGYHPVGADFLKEYNNNTIRAIILESVRAFENLEEIISVSGIDIIYIGQYDLSVSMGIPGDVGNPAIIEKIQEAVKIAQKYDKKVGCMVHNHDQAMEMIQQGVTVIVYAADTGVIYNAYTDFCQEVKGHEVI